MSLQEQCMTVIQIVRKLRPGGRAAIGYMAPNIDPIGYSGRNLKKQHMVPAYESWLQCFLGQGEWSNIGGLPAGVVVRHDIVMENSWYLGQHTADALNTERETLQSYALRLTRL